MHPAGTAESAICLIALMATRIRTQPHVGAAFLRTGRARLDPRAGNYLGILDDRKRSGAGSNPPLEVRFHHDLEAMDVWTTTS